MSTPKPFIVIVAGHNSVGDGGNPVERALTPKLAVAYQKAFKDAGYPTTYVNPTLTAGGLTGLALATGRAILDAINGGHKLVLMFDLHFNGATSGVHTIVPHNLRTDGRGMLASAFVQGRVESDIAANNPLDVQMAERISRRIVKDVSGMTLWGHNGVMLENQTNVGANGSRLGMMGATAPYRMNAVRLVIEHGGTNDASKPDFNNKCARAVLSAVEEIMEERNPSVPTTPPPTPDPPPTGDPGAPDLLSYLFGAADGYAYDPNGPVSKLWRERGNKESLWPNLIGVPTIDGNKYFAFSGGWTIIAEPGQPVRWLTRID